MKAYVLTELYNIYTLPIINNLIIGLKSMNNFRIKTCKVCNETFEAFNGENDSICSTKCRFWSKVNKVEDENSCWLWNTYIGKDGYANIRNGGNSSRAHRYSYELNIGPIPRGMFVCHTCDVRHCVRPDHLFLGNYVDNALDCAKKGRNKNAVLTMDIVKLILADDRSNAEIAKEYRVCRPVISNIKTGKTWKYVEGVRNPMGQAKGERGGTAKLTELQVEAIRKDVRTVRSIAKDYGIAHSSVSRIKIGKGWKHNNTPFDIRGDVLCGRKGEEHFGSKLTELQVIEIRKDTRNNSEISKSYGVSRTAIRAIKHGKTWSHLTTEIYSRDPMLDIKKGKDHPRFKYSDEMIQDIRDSTKSRKVLAEEYTVTESVIKNLRNKYYRLTKDKMGVTMGVAISKKKEALDEPS